MCLLNWAPEGADAHPFFADRLHRQHHDNDDDDDLGLPLRRDPRRRGQRHAGLPRRRRVQHDSLQRSVSMMPWRLAHIFVQFQGLLTVVAYTSCTKGRYHATLGPTFNASLFKFLA